MSMKKMAMAVLVSASCALAVNAADWPNWRGPNCNGISPETGINKAWSNKPPALLWKFAMGDLGFAAPSVADGKVYFIDHVATNEVIRAIDVRTGKGIWECAYLDQVGAAYGFAHTAPAVMQDKVVTVGRRGDVYCLNSKDGTKVWYKNFQKDLGGVIGGFGCSISPLIDGKKVILCPSGKENSVVALDIATGDMIWKCQVNDGPAYASPVIATIGKKKQYVVIMSANLFGLDPETGKILWTQEVKTPNGINAATPPVDNDSIYVTSVYDFGSAIIKVNGDKASEVWRDKKLQSCFSSGILIKDHIYANCGYARRRFF